MLEPSALIIPVKLLGTAAEEDVVTRAKLTNVAEAKNGIFI